MGKEYHRLAVLEAREKRHGPRAAERDLMEMFVADLERRHGTTFRFVAKPDLEGQKRKAPDFVYEDRGSGARVVFEITRPRFEETESMSAQRESLLARVKAALGPEARGGWAVAMAPLWPPPGGGRKRRRAASDIAQALAEASPKLPALGPRRAPELRLAEVVLAAAFPPTPHWISEQAVDLTEVAPAMAVRYDDSAQPAEVVDVSFQLPWICPEDRAGGELDEWRVDRAGFRCWYRSHVREATEKLGPYGESGCETLLLFDCRLGGQLTAWHGLGDLRSWHEEAVKDEGVLGHSLQPIAWEDFRGIDHIIALEICQHGIGAESLWQAEGVRFESPGDYWAIKPAGWYDD